MSVLADTTSERYFFDDIAMKGQSKQQSLYFILSRSLWVKRRLLGATMSLRQFLTKATYKAGAEEVTKS
jgi:hypothetical protein